LQRHDSKLVTASFWGEGSWRKKYGISRKILDLEILFGSTGMHATLYYARRRLNILHPMMHKFTLLLLHAVLSCAENMSNDFVVGLTSVSPQDSKPILWNYTLCGQYPGTVPPGATVMLQCQDNLPPFRYVVVHFPSSRIVSVCEIQVHVRGMPEMLAVSRALYSTGLVVQTPLVQFAADWL